MLSTADIASLNWGDAEFFGLRWVGVDLILYLRLVDTDRERIRCHWASDLKAELRWPRAPASSDEAPIRRGGPLLTWEGSLSTRSDGRWFLSLDFAADGYLEVECEKVTVAD